MISRPTVALLAAVFGLVLMAPPAHAQRGFRGGGRFAGTRRAGSFGLGWGYLPPYDYSQDASGFWPPAQPQFIPYLVFQQSVEPAQPAAKPVESLLMEEQNGKWVRVPNGGALPIAADSAPAPAAPNSPKLPSAVIVFRDGHQEEIEKYVIQGNTLYTNADYWSTGTWTRKIPIADLDVAATLKLNRDRGTNFKLPSGPSEVMVRF